MLDYDVNAYLKKKQKRQQMKDKALVALLVVNVIVFLVSAMCIDSMSLIPTFVCLCSVTYIAAFTYANTRGNE